MYIIPTVQRTDFLAGMGPKFIGYTSTFPARSIRNLNDILYAVTNLYAYGTPFDRFRQSFYGVDDIAHLETVLLSFAEKVWKYFNEEPNVTNNQANFDLFHEALCDEFVTIFAIDGRYEHTYGNAQKLVNMLFKYLTCFSDYTTFADLFSYCHVPIDGKILGKFARIYYVPCTTGTINSGKYRGVCWTNMQKEDYIALLNDYRATFTPLKGFHSWLGLEYYIWSGAPIPTTGTQATTIAEFHM